MILERIVTAGQRLVAAPFAGLWLLDPSETELVQVKSTHQKVRKGVPRRLPLERSMFGSVLRSKQPLRTDNVLDHRLFHSRAFAKREGLRACVAVPVLDGERPLGVLAVMAPPTHPFAAEDTELLQVLAGFSASVIASASAHATMAESEQQLRELYQVLSCGIVVFDGDGHILSANGMAQDILGRSFEELRGFAPDALRMDSEDGAPLTVGQGPVCVALNERRELRDVTARITRPDGQQRWLQLNLVPVRQSGSRRIDAVLTFVDVTDRKLAQLALARREERFRALVQNGAEIILIVRGDGTITYASPSVEQFLDTSEQTADYGKLPDHVHPDDLGTIQRLLETATRTRDENITEAFRLRRRDGAWRHLEAVCRNLSDVPEVAGIVLNLRDVSERKALEEQLAFRAYHDSLTDLPNRSLLVDRLTHALARNTRTRGWTALLFIDLDDFKVVNDSLGHRVGDRLLVNVAQRLRACVRPGDTVARLGGDEFNVLLQDLNNADEASAIAERILQQLGVAFALDGRDLYVTASIGIALAGMDGASADDLLRDADIAMYAAKGRGKGRWQVFQPGMNAPSVQRLELESELRQALERDELCMYYQPIIDLRSDHIWGVEALVRWRHPRRGLVPPLEFIPIAEETGLIVPIGRWILREACRQARAWDRDGRSVPPLMMSVNISGRQFQDAGLIEDVREALRASRLPPTRLRLEVTESVAMEAGPATIQKLQALKSLGIQLAIDDFGTGYSSLAYLKRFPIDGLKIDRSFVDGLGHDLQDTAIVGSVLAIARSLNLSVTAEGVETPEQLAELRALHCGHAQGYYFARPQPVAEIDKLLAIAAADRAPLHLAA